MQDLTGAREDCSDVIGVYPMLPDETCNFLVFDFDNHDDTTNGDDYANTDELLKLQIRKYTPSYHVRTDGGYLSFSKRKKIPRL